MSPDPRSPDTRSPDTAPADLAGLQRAMAAAVLGGDRAPAEAAIVADRIAPADRLDVYAGTVRVSLAQALEAAFPVVARLVGERFFHAAARRFVEAHPPERPQLLAYGGGFADFLAAFEPARSLPYLPDVARLEWERVQALFAADAPPLAAETLADVPPEAMPRLVFDLHPSLRVVASSWPIQAIWQANRQPTVPKVDLGAGGQTVLVLRPAHAVTAQPIAPADAAFLDAVAAGRPLAEAAGAAAAVDPDHDLQRALLDHLTRGSFAGWRLAAA